MSKPVTGSMIGQVETAGACSDEVRKE